MMNRLILHPTEMSQWHALLNEAQAMTQIILDEVSESYLVFLLMRFSKQASLAQSIIALDFFESMQSHGKHHIEKLRDVGDKSLLFCGFFPGMAKKRGLSLNYYTDIGQSAYLTLSSHDTSQSSLYAQLSAEFLSLTEILKAVNSPS